MRFQLHISNFVWVSIFFGILTTLFNYTFGSNDHLEQLPIIYKATDSNYLTNDFFVNSNTGFSPRYYYVYLARFFSMLIGIPWFFFLGTLLSNICTSVLTYLSGKKLFNDDMTGIFTAALVMLIPTISLGGDEILYASMFTPTTLVFPLIILSFYLFLRKKILLSIIITGVVSIFHILIGLEYGVLLLSIYIITEYSQSRSLYKALKTSTLFILLFAFLLPNLIPYFQSESSIESSVFIEILANFRHPHHYVLSEILTLKELGKLLLVTIIFGLTFGDFRKKTQSHYHAKALKLLMILLGLAVFFNWVFVEIVPLKSITTLQLLRLLNIGKWFFLLLIANHFAKSIKKRNFSPKTMIIISLLALLIIASNISWMKVLAFGIVFFVILFLLFREKKLFLILTCVVMIGFTLTINSMESTSLKRHQKSYLSSNHLTNNQSSLSEFIQSHTSKESLFLTPYLFGFIRTESKRAIVVDFKAFPFQDKAMLEWYKRIENCYGLDKDHFEESYKNLNDQKVHDLKKEYLFDYAILYQETETKMPVIYSNSEYKIIDLTSYAQ